MMKFEKNTKGLKSFILLMLLPLVSMAQDKDTRVMSGIILGILLVVIMTTITSIKKLKKRKKTEYTSIQKPPQETILDNFNQPKEKSTPLQDIIVDDFESKRKIIKDLYESNLCSSQEYEQTLNEINRKEQNDKEKKLLENQRKYEMFLNEQFEIELTKWTKPLIDKLDEARKAGLIDENQYHIKKTQAIESKRRFLSELVNDKYITFLPDIQIIEARNLYYVEMGKVNNLAKKLGIGDVIVKSQITNQIEFKLKSEWEQIILNGDYKDYSIVEIRQKGNPTLEEISTGKRFVLSKQEWINIVMEGKSSKYKIIK